MGLPVARSAILKEIVWLSMSIFLELALAKSDQFVALVVSTVARQQQTAESRFDGQIQTPEL
jgi:hypothetical protein